MNIRIASEKDIPKLNELLFQVHKIHADARPDIFITNSKKGMPQITEAYHFSISIQAEAARSVLLVELILPLLAVRRTATTRSANRYQPFILPLLSVRRGTIRRSLTRHCPVVLVSCKRCNYSHTKSAKCKVISICVS